MTHTVTELAPRLGLHIEESIVGPQNNVPGTLLTGGAFNFITVHETANTNPGADARMHRNFVAGGGGADTVSFTYCVDDKRAVQILPINQQQWAQGTTEGNATSISIETCVASDEDWSVTTMNLAKLVSLLLFTAGKDTGAVVQHNVWYGKNCPMKIRAERGAWERLIGQIQFFVDYLKVTVK